MTLSTSSPASPTSAPRWRQTISWPWVAVMLLMIAFIWGNSLVPGDDSGSLSQSVMETVKACLAAVGLPNGWVTNFVVRKTAHFTEYMVLGIITMQAFRPHRTPSALALLVTALVLAGIPCLDETIQLFVSGRAGQVTDALIDCSGALTGVLLTLLASCVWRRSHREAGRRE